jgi:ParB/RepB/Spo0J family partition protein
MKIKDIKIDDIVVKKQIRTVFNPETLKSLAVSIKEKGVLQPILVKKIGDDYKIVAGERRFLASQEAGLTEIPACILDDKDNEKEIQLIENTQREDLNPLDLANAFKDLRDSGKTLDEIAALAGRTKQHIIEILSLMELQDEDKEKIKNGEPYTKFSRQKSQKKAENDNNNDDLQEKSMTENKVNTVYLTDSNTFNEKDEENQEVNESSMTYSNIEEEPKTEGQKSALEISKTEDQRSETPPQEFPDFKDQRPVKPDLKSIKVEPEEVLDTQTDYPVYDGMPKEEPDEEVPPVEVSPESFVNEEGVMVDLQNRPVYETEEGYAVIIEPADVKELISKFNEGNYGFKLQLGDRDSLILTGIDGTKNIYNVINCLVNNVKDYINV